MLLILLSKSDNYTSAIFKAGLISSLTIASLVGTLSYLWKLPFSISVFETSLIFIITGLVGAATAIVCSFTKRLSTGKEDMKEQVEKTAFSVFVKEEVFNTKDRTGILIYVSLFEKMITIIADKGINEKKNNWDDVIEKAIAKMKKGRVVDGVITAIDLCGKAIVDAGFLRKDDDINELDNKPIQLEK